MSPQEARKLAALVIDWSLEANAWPVEKNLPMALMDADAGRRALVRCAWQLREALARWLPESELAELLNDPVLEPVEQNAERPGG